MAWRRIEARLPQLPPLSLPDYYLAGLSDLAFFHCSESLLVASTRHGGRVRLRIAWLDLPSRPADQLTSCSCGTRVAGKSLAVSYLHPAQGASSRPKLPLTTRCACAPPSPTAARLTPH
jgi:hypothetical protein